MKKAALVLVFLLLCFSLGACANTSVSSSVVQIESVLVPVSSAPFLGDGYDASATSLLQSTPDPDAAWLVSFVGKYVCADEGSFAPDYFPTLTFHEDGTFHFWANLLEGMGDVRGTWHKGDDIDGLPSLRLMVTETAFSGFIGDNVTQIDLIVQDQNTLVWSADTIGGTNRGDVFTRQ